MNRANFILILLILASQHLKSQSIVIKDSVSIMHPVKLATHPANLIVPAAFITYGIAAQYAKPLKKLDKNTHLSVSKHIFQCVTIDDYLQFAPAVGVYAFDLVGIKAKHNFRDRTIVMAMSHLMMCASVQTMKHTINVRRPNGANLKSFPSGHTATAFVGAHILFKEYKDSCPWIGIGGYAMAAATGTMRVTNKKHWVSDVIAGAGIGMLSAEIAYLLLPATHKLFGIKETGKQLVITPVVGTKQLGFGCSYVF